MNFVFFGTPEIAAIILEKLIKAGFIPSAVICNPDKPVGRKKIITSPPTKILAEKHNIKVLQPEKLEIGNLKFEIGEIDFAVVAAYAKIIPKEILDISKLGSIGVHPSLLPKHRGASPIQSAILSDDKETGVSLFLMDEKVDHGPILAQRELENYELGIMNYGTLMRKLAELGGDLLVKTLPKFVAGEIEPQIQDEVLATFTKKFKTEDGFVNLEKDDPIIIKRKVRALNPEPGVYTIKDEKRMKILEAEIVDGKIKLKKIQMEGKKPVGCN